MTLLHHEQIYRGKETLEKIRTFPICICGAGAIGSNLAENLVRQGFRNLTVIDKDRIEDRNINTQIWTLRDIGALKINALKHRLFEVGKVEVYGDKKELKAERDHRYFRFAKLVIDAFDNSKSRQLVKEACSAGDVFGDKSNCRNCLHIGFSGDYGEIIWNEDYQVPNDKGEDDCDYPLARNLILLLVAVASEVIIKYVTSAIKENYTVTLKDFHIGRYKP